MGFTLDDFKTYFAGLRKPDWTKIFATVIEATMKCSSGWRNDDFLKLEPANQHDQALTLRGCFSEAESDRREDWPKSIFLVLRKGFGLHDDLQKFVRGVIASH